MSTPITIVVNAKTDAATTDIGKFVSGLLGGLKSIENNFNTLRDAAAGFLAFDTLKQFADKAVTARQEDAKLEASLRSTGQYSLQYKEQLEANATALRDLTGANIDTTEAVERTLISFDVGKKDIKDYTALVLDMAAAMQTDATSAALMFGRAMDGENISFGKFRLELDQSLPLIERRAQAIALMQQKFGGQAQAQFAAAIPEINQFKAVMADAEQAVGELALKVSAAFLGPMMSAMKSTDAESGRTKANLQAAGNAAVIAAGGIGEFVAHNPQLTEMTVTLGIIYKLFGQIYGLVPVIGAALAGWSIGSSLSDTAPVKSVLDKATAGVMMLWEHIKARVDMIGANDTQARAIKDRLDANIKEWTRFGYGMSDESGNKKPQPKQAFHLQADDFMALRQQSIDDQKNDALIAQNRLISAKSVSDAELKIKQTALQAEAELNEASYAKDKLSLSDYFAERISLVQREGDLEIAEKQKLLDRYNTDLASLPKDSKEYHETLKDQATLNAEVIALREKLKEKLLQVDAEQYLAEKQLEDKRQSQTLANFQAQLDLINNNPWKSDFEKASESVGIMQQESKELQRQIDFQKQLTTSANEDVRLSAEAKLNDLLKQQADLRYKLVDAQDPTHFGGFRASLRDGTKPTPTGRELIDPYKQLDDFLKNSLQATLDGISNGITGVITGSETLGQAEVQLRNSIIAGLVQMLLQYTVFNQARMLLDRLFFTQSTVLKSAEVGTHVAGEGAKTAATAAGTQSRGALHLGETIFHGIQIVIRVAAHLAGEVLMTIATLAQSALRVGAIVAESIVYVIEAAVKAMSSVADIPFVGPVLAIAALGAVMAAGMGALGGGGKRELGGQVLGGSSYLVGERGPELFMPGVSGGIIPHGRTMQMLSGAGSPGSGGGSPQLQVLVIHGEEAYNKWLKETAMPHIRKDIRMNKKLIGIPS